MPLHPRTMSLLLARTSLGALILGCTLIGVWMANDLQGQAPPAKKPRVEEEEDTPKAPPKKKPRVEEEEDTKTPPKKKPTKKRPRVEEEEDTRKAPPKRKVIRVDEEEDPKDKNTSPRPAVPASSDLRELAQQARHLGVKQLFLDLAVPHDHVVFKKTEHVTINSESNRGQEEDIEPIPLLLSRAPAKSVKGLTLRTPRGKPIKRGLISIQYVDPYETIARKLVGAFLKEGFDRLPAQNKMYLSHFDVLTAAEQALSSVLRWHESARQTGQRQGDAWASVESSLRKQLLDDILLKQLEMFAEAKDWDRVLALTRRLASSYPSKADRERIALPLAAMLKSALNDPTGAPDTKQMARKRLQELESEFPDNRVFQPINDGLREQAARLLQTAKDLGKDKNKDTLAEIRNLLNQAEEIYPQLAGLRAYKTELNADHPVLRVGVRGELPRYLSPAWACTDSEKRAVEMLFESLVKLTPDEAGIFRYRPGLAEDHPTVVSLGRQFQLPRHAMWSNLSLDGTWSKGRRLDSGDIRETVSLLKKGLGSDRSCAWGELLDKVEVTGDPFRVTLRMNQGYVDPLALMTFKILPRDRRVDTEAFAKNPVCSGPYVFDPTRGSDEKRRECLFFVANPAYGGRPGKRDLPRIQEIRFYSYKKAVEELRHGNLDLILDLTAQEAFELGQKADQLQIAIPLPSAARPNRRIYFLAINQSKLPNASLRKALAHAINREKLLNTHFRGPLAHIHKALNGPFPAGSWACNPTLTHRQGKGSLDLYDAEKAHGLSQQPAARKAAAQGPFQLKYPKDDPALAEALKELCAQVKETTGVVLELAPCDPYQLRKDVRQTQSYDLAYWHYDFPDETYWLWPLLGRPFRADGDSNFLKFSDGEMQKILKEAMSYRDFAQLRKHLRTLHDYLNLNMPLIPLWQLDPLFAHHQEVKAVALDPTLVFSNVEEWRLQRK